MIFIAYQFGVHWLINIFVKFKNDSYSLNESFLLVTLDSMIVKNQNNELQVNNILKYFDDMKHINVEHISLTNIPKQSDNYSCGVFVCLYSYCASSTINDDLPKDEWCDIFFSITATYDIQKFRSVIHDFCLRLQYDETSTINKSTSSSSSSLISIHEGLP